MKLSTDTADPTPCRCLPNPIYKTPDGAEKTGYTTAKPLENTHRLNTDDIQRAGQAYQPSFETFLVQMYRSLLPTRRFSPPEEEDSS
ncbi:MAG: hypothetical protein KH202_13105 [Clostridiales bacterium]|nr:hypothetical protein [Clostridiales bacterium]